MEKDFSRFSAGLPREASDVAKLLGGYLHSIGGATHPEFEFHSEVSTILLQLAIANLPIEWQYNVVALRVQFGIWLKLLEITDAKSSKWDERNVVLLFFSEQFTTLGIKLDSEKLRLKVIEVLQGLQAI